MRRSSQLLLLGSALSYFFLEGLRFSNRRFVRRRERCGSDDVSIGIDGISFLPFARARTRFERKKDPPPAVAASRARLVIDASLKPSVFRLCARAHTRERDRERQRETEDKERLVFSSFKRRDDGLTLSPITTLSSHKIESKINRFNARVYGKRTESNNTRGRDFFD